MFVCTLYGMCVHIHMCGNGKTTISFSLSGQSGPLRPGEHREVMET